MSCFELYADEVAVARRYLEETLAAQLWRTSSTIAGFRAKLMKKVSKQKMGSRKNFSHLRIHLFK